MDASASSKSKKSAPAASAAPAAATSAPAAAAPAAAAPKKTAKSESGSTATDPQIASAKSQGMVWVNKDSGVYHKSGRWYGKTKNGKFMSESDAKAAGYRAAEKE